MKLYRAGGNGLAALVLAGPVFSQGENIKVYFYKKQVIKKSASVIFWLVCLFYWAIMGGGGIWKGPRLSVAHSSC